MSQTSDSIFESIYESVHDQLEKTFQTVRKSFEASFEHNINMFIEKISTEYDLDKSSLKSLWEASCTSEKKGNKKSGKKGDKKGDKKSNKKPDSSKGADVSELVDLDDISSERLLKCQKAELMALCRARKIPVSGNKATLIDKLTEYAKGEKKGGARKNSSSSKDSIHTKLSSKKNGIPPKNGKKRGVEDTAKVLKKLKATSDRLCVRKNAFGNHEHPETHLVFNIKTSEVIGRQNDDGSIMDLTDDDIQNCKKYKFSYQIPDNLDKNTDDDTKVAGIEDDSDEEIPILRKKKVKKEEDDEEEEEDDEVEDDEVEDDEEEDE